MGYVLGYFGWVKMCIDDGGGEIIWPERSHRRAARPTSAETHVNVKR